MKLLKRFVLVICLLAFGIKGVAGVLVDYHQQDQLEASIQQTQEKEEIKGEPVAQPMQAQTQDNAVLGVSREPELPEEIKAIVPDFEELSKINSDVVAWIYIPAVDISYPVVKGSDNAEYLDIAFDGSKSHTGSVYMNATNAKDFSDENTFVFAHNMKNGSMFGNLDNFIRDEDLVNTDPYIWVFTPEHTYQYEIFALYTTTESSDMYVVPDKEFHDAYVKKAVSQAQFTHDCDTKGKLITLSTCFGLAGSGNRLLVHGSLIAEF